MAKVLILNPAKRKKVKKVKKDINMPRKKTRSAAQKAATKKMIAARRKSLKKNPTKKRKSPAQSATAKKPAKKRAKKAIMKKRTYRKNPSPRKNNMMNMVVDQLKSGAIQASGAIGVDLLFAPVSDFLPEQLNSGYARHAVKGVIAIAVGAIASMVTKSEIPQQMALGSLTATMIDAGREAIESNTAWNLGYTNAAYIPQNMGYFMNDNNNQSLGMFTQHSKKLAPSSQSVSAAVSNI